MLDLDEKAQGLGASLTVIGNGTPDEAAVFHETLLDGKPRLLTDPDLSSYKAMELRRSLFASVQPKTFFAGFRLTRLGFRGAQRQGDSIQQGGAFVITPRHDVVYSFFSPTPDVHANYGDIVACLDGLT